MAALFLAVYGWGIIAPPGSDIFLQAFCITLGIMAALWACKLISGWLEPKPVIYYEHHEVFFTELYLLSDRAILVDEVHCSVCGLVSSYTSYITL